MPFLFDANVFIEAKNRYYAFDICPGFWDWMDTVVGNDVLSVMNVYQELAVGNDDLAKWATARVNDGWFLDVSDTATQTYFAAIAQAVQSGGYTPQAVQTFLSAADPWLVAKALDIGATVVTHEVLQPNAQRRVLLPNVCQQFGVPFVDTFDTLRTLSASFTLGP